MSVNLNNSDRAISAWGVDMPSWVRLLAAACDQTNQRAVGDQLGKSSGYVSRLINRNYAGSYVEAETIVRARFGSEYVDCPVMGEIPLRGCVRNRRREGPARNHLHQLWAKHCPNCVFNTDREEDL